MFLLLLLALGVSIGHVSPIFGQAPVLDPNCYFPKDDDPSQIDSIYGSQDGQAMGWGIQSLPQLWDEDPLAYVRVENLTPGIKRSEGVATGPAFNLQNLQRRPIANFQIPANAKFAHFRSKEKLDMYTVIDDRVRIYWEVAEGSYDSARMSMLRFSRPWANDTTYSTPLYTEPYIATFPGNETASIVQAVGIVYYEGNKDSIFFLRYHFEGESEPPRVLQPKEALFYDTLRLVQGPQRFYFQQSAWRNENDIDLLRYDPLGNIMYYKNDKPFTFPEFFRAIHEDTIFTRWENPRITSRYQFDPRPAVVRSMPCLPRPGWDRSQDLIFAAKLDSLDSDDLHLIVFKGGPDMGSKRFYVDSAAMLIRSPGSSSDFPFTGMSYDVWNAGDMTGTGNNVLMWAGSGSLRHYFFFYVTGRALDSLADIYFAMEPEAIGTLDTLTANADSYQDVIMGHHNFYTWEDHEKGKNYVGTVRVVYGSPQIPVRLNPKFSVGRKNEDAATATAYPNPFLDHVVLTADFELAQEIEVQVWDVLGRLVFSHGYSPGHSHSLLVQLPHQLAAGSYILRAMQESYSAKALITKN